MSRDIMGATVLAAGLWAIFAAGIMGFTPITPRGYAWVVTGSDKMSNRPDLVRAAMPSQPVLASVQ